MIGREEEVGFQSGFKSCKGIGIPDSQRKRVPEFWANDRKALFPISVLVRGISSSEFANRVEWWCFGRLSIGFRY